jgi:multicomponent Na+:H+ antiporter subunit E
MPNQDASLSDQQEAPSFTAQLSAEVSDGARLTEPTRSAVMTTTVLIVLWAGFHWDDPASWIVGAPTALIGCALILFLPTSAQLRLSPLAGLRFAKFAIVGVLRGAIDVSWRSLSPQTLQPGCLHWRTCLPEGRPRQLFALAITLLPGTLTAQIEDDILTVYALNLSDATRTELAALEAHIADLYKLEYREMAQ